MSRKINPYLVELLTAPFAGMLDAEIVDWRERIDTNNAADVKELIAGVLKPVFDRYDDDSQRLLRENLSYFLSIQYDHWDKLFDMSMPPIEVPDDARQFYVWLWEALFPGENYMTANVEDVEVVKDLDALQTIRVRPELRTK